MQKSKIVLWDIETSGITVSTWNLYPESIPHSNILQDWYIICACWKELDKDRIKSVSVLDDEKRFKKDSRDDYYVIKTLREMLEDANVIIGHNTDKFDMKMFNSRLIYHKLPPLPKILSIDTLKEVKKIARFTSNRLDFLGDKLGSGGKLKTSPGLWLRACNGDKAAIREMVTYNKVDVKVLEELYLRIRGYMKSHPNIAEPLTQNCPKCDSDNVRKHKPRISATGIRYQQYQCNNCGSYFQSGKAIEKPESKL